MVSKEAHPLQNKPRYMLPNFGDPLGSDALNMSFADCLLTISLVDFELEDKRRSFHLPITDVGKFFRYAHMTFNPFSNSKFIFIPEFFKLIFNQMSNIPKVINILIIMNISISIYKVNINKIIILFKNSDKNNFMEFLSASPISKINIFNKTSS